MIDIDNNTETIFGDDIDIEDIVWYGGVDSVEQLAKSVGITNTAPMAALASTCEQAIKQSRTIHFLPPYRYDTMIQIFDLLNIHPKEQRSKASLELINAVVALRSAKDSEEIEAIETACRLSHAHHRYEAH